MGELTVTTFLTLDGVMQAPGGPTEDPSGGFAHGGWVAPYFDDDMGRIIDANFGHADAFLLGRTTYDIFSSYWPQYPNQDEIVAKSLNNLPKFVASRTRTSFDWSGTSHIADVVREVAALKERFAREVQVHGSGNLLQTLVANDLIDEYRLFTFPVLLGTGKRLFGDGTVPGALTLVRSSVSSSGVVYSVYRRAGPVRTGTVG